MGVVVMNQLDQLENFIWKRAVQEQREKRPVPQMTMHLCHECATSLVQSFMGNDFVLPPTYDQLPHPIPQGQDKLSWVLFKRRSDPDQPLMMFTMETCGMDQVFEQGKTILASGNIRSSFS